MWNKSPQFFLVKVKVPKRFNLALPIPVWVVKDFLGAVKNLAWLGEIVLNFNQVKGISLRGMVEVMQTVISDLTKYKGLDLVHVESGDITVKISLK